jgi:hypothetical protein
MRFQQDLSLIPEDNHINTQHHRTINLSARIMLQSFGYKNYTIKLNMRSTVDRCSLYTRAPAKLGKGMEFCGASAKLRGHQYVKFGRVGFPKFRFANCIIFLVNDAFMFSFHKRHHLKLFYRSCRF